MEGYNLKNLDKHKISFNIAIEIFKNPVLTKSDARDYGGEVRYLTIVK
ncbi:BrnT family toxin [Geminocystis sp. GBBB08]|nr:BrnT family toxin [Geminocystis sp. GBBB08]MBL1210440.1 BrnT family toxin [Geminocystis sp. GBBB08]